MRITTNTNAPALRTTKYDLSVNKINHPHQVHSIVCNVLFDILVGTPLPVITQRMYVNQTRHGLGTTMHGYKKKIPLHDIIQGEKNKKECYILYYCQINPQNGNKKKKSVDGSSSSSGRVPIQHVDLT